MIRTRIYSCLLYLALEVCLTILSITVESFIELLLHNMYEVLRNGASEGLLQKEHPQPHLHALEERKEVFNCFCLMYGYDPVCEACS